MPVPFSPPVALSAPIPLSELQDGVPLRLWIIVRDSSG